MEIFKPEAENGKFSKIGLDARKPVFIVCEQHMTDQPAHLSNLISAFVIRFLKSIISKLAMSEISNF